MGCIDTGKLRAYCDGELSDSDTTKLESHIAQCVTCREQLDGVRRTGAFVAVRLNPIAPLPTEAPPGLEASLAELRRRQPRMADTTVRQTGWIGGLLAGAIYHWRASVAGLAAAALVISLIALPPVRTIADDLLGVFRVQKFTQVTLDPATLSNLPMLDPTKMGTFDSLSQNPKVYNPATPAEAAAKLDFPLRLPQQLPAGVLMEAKFTVMETFSVGYTFDLAKAGAYLESMGIRGFPLPKSLSGRKISATLPVHVIAAYGQGSSGPAMALFQGKSPVVEVPDGVDIDEVFNAIYSIPGLPPELVVQLRAIDWKTTAPVPVLKGDTSRKVTVDGAEGLLVRNDLQKLTVLLWQKDGVVYGLAGEVADADLIATANSLR